MGDYDKLLKRLKDYMPKHLAEAPVTEAILNAVAQVVAEELRDLKYSIEEAK